MPPRDAAERTQPDPARQREANAAKGFPFAPAGFRAKGARRRGGPRRAPRSSRGGGYTVSRRGEPAQAPAVWGHFTPAVRACSEWVVFRCLLRQNQKPLSGVKSKAKASRLQALPVLTASGAGCRRRRHLGTLRFPRAFPC